MKHRRIISLYVCWGATTYNAIVASLAVINGVPLAAVACVILAVVSMYCFTDEYFNGW
jgi:hypothetical protein